MDTDVKLLNADVAQSIVRVVGPGFDSPHQQTVWYADFGGEKLKRTNAQKQKVKYGVGAS